MFEAILRKIFGTKHEREMKRMRPLVAAINDLEPKMAALDDAMLRRKTFEFRERLDKGATLDDLLPEAFAACREAADACRRHAPLRRAADRRHGRCTAARSPR